MDQVWKQYNSINGLIAQYLNPIEQDNIINQLNALQELKEAKKQSEHKKHNTKTKNHELEV